MLNCCHPYSSYLYLIMSPTSFITSTALSPVLHLHFTYIYITSALSPLLLLTVNITYILYHTVYILFIYFYITTLHILCTLHSSTLHFLLDANCISLPQYLYSVQ